MPDGPNQLGNIISSWTYTLDVPPTGDENVRINLWLTQGHPPSDANEVEVVIKNFEFVPLDPLQPARLKNVARFPDGQAQFVITGSPGRQYGVQASTNLADWEPLTTVLAASNSVPFADPNSASIPQQFYRTRTLP